MGSQGVAAAEARVMPEFGGYGGFSNFVGIQGTTENSLMHCDRSKAGLLWRLKLIPVKAEEMVSQSVGR
jgi:hypothetical protein